MVFEALVKRPHFTPEKGRMLYLPQTPFKEKLGQKTSPHASVYTENDLELGKPNTLICFINGFHPAAIKVSWTKNTLPVTEGVTQTVLYSNKDFTFRMFSYLSFTPELGAMYSCQVQHSALPETLTTFWGE
ncbi:UNVERIFIED_CONTAM: hypothetical protein FKN15_062008 [Acipenser sinensis]